MTKQKPGDRFGDNPSRLIYTEGTAQHIDCVKKQHILGFNIVGVKGTDGSRKRPRGATGGWRTGWHGFVPTRTSSIPWRRARRRQGEGSVYNDNVKIQVDEPSNNQVTEVVMLVDEVDTIQENMEVEIETSSVVGPR